MKRWPGVRRPRMASSWSCGTRTRCGAAKPAGSATSRPALARGLSGLIPRRRWAEGETIT